MDDARALKMPVRRFWMMLNNIERVSAERDMRNLTLHFTAAQGSKDGIEKYRQSLVIEMGDVVKRDTEEDDFDAGGWAELKRMAGK